MIKLKTWEELMKERGVEVEETRENPFDEINKIIDKELAR